MDGYLAKPFKADQLTAAVEAGAIVGGPRESAGNELARPFVNAYPALVDDLERAVAGGRTAEAEVIARRLAAGLETVGAGDAAAAAGRVVEASAEGEPLGPAFEELTAVLDRLEPQLGALAGSGRP
jgi:hypothetical protein